MATNTSRVKRKLEIDLKDLSRIRIIGYEDFPLLVTFKEGSVSRVGIPAGDLTIEPIDGFVESAKILHNVLKRTKSKTSETLRINSDASLRDKLILKKASEMEKLRRNSPDEVIRVERELLARYCHELDNKIRNKVSENILFAWFYARMKSIGTKEKFPEPGNLLFPRKTLAHARLSPKEWVNGPIRKIIEPILSRSKDSANISIRKGIDMPIIYPRNDQIFNAPTGVETKISFKKNKYPSSEAVELLCLISSRLPMTNRKTRDKLGAEWHFVQKGKQIDIPEESFYAVGRQINGLKGTMDLRSNHVEQNITAEETDYNTEILIKELDLINQEINLDRIVGKPTKDEIEKLKHLKSIVSKNDFGKIYASIYSIESKIIRADSLQRVYAGVCTEKDIQDMFGEEPKKMSDNYVPRPNYKTSLRSLLNRQKVVDLSNYAEATVKPIQAKPDAEAFLYEEP